MFPTFSSKFFFAIKSTASALVSYFACFNLSSNISAENLLKTVVIYLSLLGFFFLISSVFVSDFLSNVLM